jgi:hypothetical protein
VRLQLEKVSPAVPQRGPVRPDADAAAPLIDRSRELTRVVEVPILKDPLWPDDVTRAPSNSRQRGELTDFGLGVLKASSFYSI